MRNLWCLWFKNFADFLRSGRNFPTQKSSSLFPFFLVLTLEELCLPLKIPTVLKDHCFVPESSFCLFVTIHLGKASDFADRVLAESEFKYTQ